jgi:nucleotide-binding universal stress UspA family protein
MPLLRQADVRLVSVNGFESEPVRQFTPAAEIAATLSRHGIRVEALSFESTRRSVADELLAQALDFGADLLVMGCYGHARFRERILGGCVAGNAEGDTASAAARELTLRRLRRRNSMQLMMSRPPT